MTETDAFLFAAAQRRHAANDRAGAVVLLDELLRMRPDHAAALLLLSVNFSSSQVRCRVALATHCGTPVCVQTEP